MVITTDFKTFANSYHKNTGNKYLPKLPNILIMDIIKMATEQTNLEYWKGLSNIQSTHNNTVIVNRMKLNNALKVIFEPIIDGDVEWTEDGLIETQVNPHTNELDTYTNLWDLFVDYWAGAMVETPFLTIGW